MFTENEKKLNQQIQQLLIELYSNSGEDVQLEIVYLIKQIDRLKFLILQKKNSFFNNFFSKGEDFKLTILLEDVFSMLTILKTGNANIKIIKECRINLEKNINNYQEIVNKLLLNTYLSLYYTKSNTLKILCGLIMIGIPTILGLSWTINIHHGYLLEEIGNLDNPNLLGSNLSDEILNEAVFENQINYYNSSILTQIEPNQDIEEEYEQNHSPSFKENHLSKPPE